MRRYPAFFLLSWITAVCAEIPKPLPDDKSVAPLMPPSPGAVPGVVQLPIQAPSPVALPVAVPAPVAAPPVVADNSSPGQPGGPMLPVADGVLKALPPVQLATSGAPPAAVPQADSILPVNPGQPGGPVPPVTDGGLKAPPTAVPPVAPSVPIPPVAPTAPVPPAAPGNAAPGQASSPLSFTETLLKKLEAAQIYRTLEQQAVEGIRMTKSWEERSKTTQRQSPVNGSVVLKFNASLPTIVAAVFELVDIELQAGEIITSVNIGDSARWTVANASSQSGELMRPHLIIKPMDVGLKTSLVVTTTRRSYHINLQSDIEGFMHYVTFEYPDDPEELALRQRKEAQEAEAKRKMMAELEADKRRAEKERRAAAANLPKPYDPGPPLRNFVYEIRGKATWKPIKAWTDGVKTYIRMPRFIVNAETPVLHLLRPGGFLGLFNEKVLTNYRVLGSKYEVDTVIDRAVLTIGKEQVTLIRRNAPPPPAKPVKKAAPNVK
jgi:type IV secretion system protein VirB9